MPSRFLRAIPLASIGLASIIAAARLAIEEKPYVIAFLIVGIIISKYTFDLCEEK